MSANIKNEILKLIRKRSGVSIFVSIALIGSVWFYTESIGLVMLMIFLVGLAMLYMSLSGRKLRKQFTVCSCIAFLACGALWFTFPNDREVFTKEFADIKSAVNDLESEILNNQNQTNSDTSSSSSSESTTNVGETNTVVDENWYPVSSVTDGDTIKVNIAGTVQTIRLIGINTPEVYGGVQCYGREASARMKQLVESKNVRIESDSTQGELDKYDRLLRFVFLEDGRNVGEVMLREGFAREYTYNKPYKYIEQFKQAQTYAKDNKLGMWSEQGCS